MNRRVCVLVLLLAVVGAPAAASALEAQLDRRVVGAGDTVTLLLRLRAADRADEIDLAPLTADFDILDVAQSRRTMVVNGRRDDSLDLHLTLAPRGVGTLTVPALRAGGSSTAPIPLEVVAAGAQAPSGSLDSSAGDAPAGAPLVAVELVADSREPYVQEQVRVRVRLVSQAPLLEGAIDEPRVDGALVQRVGDDRHERREIDGRPVEVVEREFAIFPQSSGSLRIPPVAFDGRVRDETRPHPRAGFGSIFDDLLADDFFAGSGFASAFGPGLAARLHGPGSPFDRLLGLGSGSRRVQARSDVLTLKVRPRPAAAGADWWIPARSLELHEQWTSDPRELRVGEPVTRTLTVRARGVSAAQLPPLEAPPVDGVKQYADPPATRTLEDAGELVAIQTVETAVIPTRPGTVTLPPVELAWWDTRSDELRRAVVPERTLEVLPARVGAAGSGPDASTLEDGDDAPGLELARGATRAAGALALPVGWPTAAGLALAVALAGATALGLRQRTSRARAASSSGPATSSSPSLPETHPERRPETAPRLAVAERALRRACRAGDPEAAIAALRGLASAHAAKAAGAPPLDTLAWARGMGDDFGREVDRLYGVRYSPDARAWRGAELWSAWTNASGRRARRSAASAPLPPLYPARRGEA